MSSDTAMKACQDSFSRGIGSRGVGFIKPACFCAAVLGCLLGEGRVTFYCFVEHILGSSGSPLSAFLGCVCLC